MQEKPPDLQVKHAPLPAKFIAQNAPIVGAESLAYHGYLHGKLPKILLFLALPEDVVGLGIVIGIL